MVEQTVRTSQRVTVQQFDSQGRVVKTVLPDRTYTLREYDNFGRVTAEIDQLAIRHTNKFSAVVYRRVDDC